MSKMRNLSIFIGLFLVLYGFVACGGDIHTEILSKSDEPSADVEVQSLPREGPEVFIEDDEIAAVEETPLTAEDEDEGDFRGEEDEEEEEAEDEATEDEEAEDEEDQGGAAENANPLAYDEACEEELAEIAAALLQEKHPLQLKEVSKRSGTKPYRSEDALWYFQEDGILALKGPIRPSYLKKVFVKGAKWPSFWRLRATKDCEAILQIHFRAQEYDNKTKPKNKHKNYLLTQPTAFEVDAQAIRIRELEDGLTIKKRLNKTLHYLPAPFDAAQCRPLQQWQAYNGVPLYLTQITKKKKTRNYGSPESKWDFQNDGTLLVSGKITDPFLRRYFREKTNSASQWKLRRTPECQSILTFHFQDVRDVPEEKRKHRTHHYLLEEVSPGHIQAHRVKLTEEGGIIQLYEIRPRALHFKDTPPTP